MRTIRQYQTDANGYFKEEVAIVEDAADTSTDLRLQNALRRRGCACEVAGILSYQMHELIVEEYFRAMQEEPGNGWRKVSVQQVYAADVELFKLFARATQNGLDPADDGSLALDKLVESLLNHKRVVQHLSPRQAPGGGEEPRQSTKRSNDAEVNRLKEKVKKLEQAKGSSASSNKGNGKGGASKKSKGNGKRKSFIPLPAELHGLEPMWGGKRVCFAFNLDGCHGGHNCTKGVHVCMRCGANDHGARSKACPKKR